jgi:hypothetical protein
MKKLIIIFILYSSNLLAAPRYWVGGSGHNWSDGHVWATTSGGAATAPNPTSTDDVFIDAASQGAGLVLTIDAGATCNSLNLSGTSGGLGGTQIIQTADILVDNTFNGSTAAWTNTGGAYAMQFDFLNSSTGTFTSNGMVMGCYIHLNGSGTLTLSDAFALDVGNALYLTGAGFNANNRAVTIGSFLVDGAAGYNVVGGSGTWTVTDDDALSAFGGSFHTWHIEDASSGTLNFSNTPIKFTSTSGSVKTIELDFSGSSMSDYVYHDFWINGSAAGTFDFTSGGAQTLVFNDLKITNPPNSVEFNVNWSPVSLHVNGTAGNLNQINGHGYDLTMAAGNVCLDYMDLRNLVIVTANGYADHSTNGGGNTGWTFAACPSGHAFTQRIIIH